MSTPNARTAPWRQGDPALSRFGSRAVRAALEARPPCGAVLDALERKLDEVGVPAVAVPSSAADEDTERLPETGTLSPARSVPGSVRPCGPSTADFEPLELGACDWEQDQRVHEVFGFSSFERQSANCARSTTEGDRNGAPQTRRDRVCGRDRYRYPFVTAATHVA
jgi:hypothetical protein